MPGADGELRISSRDTTNQHRKMLQKFETILMPTIGKFNILELDCSRDPGGKVTHVSRISLRCSLCNDITESAGEHLVQLPGGTVLTCAKCGTRQAVSNASFGEFDRIMHRAQASKAQPGASDTSSAPETALRTG